MTAQFDLVEVVAIPLTPVHVGGGEEAVLRPESYRIAGDRLEVFAVARALEALPDGERRQLADAIVRDPLGGLDRVRQKLRPEAVLETIGLGEASREELQLVLDPNARRQRRGDVQLFQLTGGRPVLPGSTLKGALRTAWLARCADGIEHVAGHASGQRHTELERRAFGLADGKAKTDTDPMRDVTVADALLPPGATRIDRVMTWKKGGRGAENGYDFSDTGQMHWERLRSVADGAEPPLLRLSLGVRSDAVRRGRSGLRADAVPPRAPVAVAELLAALNAHHARLWGREADEKFFAGEAGRRLRATREPLAALNLDGPDPDAALVRVGRGGHAESKSVAAFRKVHRPQARDPREQRAPEGSTRHVVEIGGAPLPFGWILLVRADRYAPPSRWLDPPKPVSRPREDRPGRGGQEGAPAVPLLFRRGEVAHVDGERVTIQEDVTPGASAVNVAFPGGDIETVSIDEIEKP